MEDLCHKQKPSKTDILQCMAQALAPVAPTLPLSRLSGDTLLLPCACGQLPKKSTTFLRLPWDVLSSSVRKEGAGSRDSEEGLGAVTGLMGRRQKHCWGVKAVSGRMGVGSGWLSPPRRVQKVPDP